MNYTRKLGSKVLVQRWHDIHTCLTLWRTGCKVIGTTMNLSTSRASAVRQTPPVEQAGDSKNKHAIKLLLALLDGIIPSKTNLKAESIGLMPRLSLRPLSHEEFCTFGHVRYVLFTDFEGAGSGDLEPKGQQLDPWKCTENSWHLHYCLIYYIVVSLFDRNAIFCMLFTACLLSLCCTCTTMCRCTTMRRLTPPL